MVTPKLIVAARIRGAQIEILSPRAFRLHTKRYSDEPTHIGGRARPRRSCYLHFDRAITKIRSHQDGEHVFIGVLMPHCWNQLDRATTPVGDYSGFASNRDQVLG